MGDIEHPAAYMPKPEPAPQKIELLAPPNSWPLLNLQQQAQQAAAGGAPAHYTQEHKEFIVRARLQAQPLFDNKLHKNDMLWDDLCQAFYLKFPEQAHRTKQSVKDQFNIPQKSFRDYCKTDNSFRAGKDSGMGRDQMHAILDKKRSGVHHCFEEFSQEQRPMSLPPTIYHGGNAVAQGQAVVAGSQELEIQCGQPLATSSPSEQDSQEFVTSSLVEDEGEQETVKKRRLDMDAVKAEDSDFTASVKSVGETPLNRSVRLGGADTGSCAGTPGETPVRPKKGRATNLTAYFQAKEEARKGAGGAGGGMQDMMMLYMKMQQDRDERNEERERQAAIREEARAHKDAEDRAAQNLQFMQFMAAILKPPPHNYGTG
jgi:hypothetical protein